MADISSGSSVTVAATTVTEVLSPRVGDAQRVAVAIANVGANTAFLVASDYDQANTTNKGIYLPAGGSWVDAASPPYLPVQARITAYSTAGTTLSVWERVIS